MNCPWVRVALCTSSLRIPLASMYWITLNVLGYVLDYWVPNVRHTHYSKLGTHWCFNPSVQSTIHKMNVERLKSKAQSTFDFSSMYTTVDLEELKQEMKAYILLCFSQAKHSILTVHPRKLIHGLISHPVHMWSNKALVTRSYSSWKYTHLQNPETDSTTALFLGFLLWANSCTCGWERKPVRVAGCGSWK